MINTADELVEALENVQEFCKAAGALSADIGIICDDKIRVHVGDNGFLESMPGEMMCRDFSDEEYPTEAYKVVGRVEFYRLIKEQKKSHGMTAAKESSR